MGKVLCIYHGNCADGFGAAWVVHKKLGKIDFHAGHYGNPPPDVEGRDVAMVDYSYKRPELRVMASKAASILIIDHHKTAQADLEEYAVHNPVNIDNIEQVIEATQPGLGRVRALFDMNRSGAGMTWDFFYPGDPRPALLDHIEDRDLWRFALPHTREIQAALFSHPYDFGLWDELMTLDPQKDLALEGRAIERKHHKDIAELVAVSRRPMKIGGYVVPVANLPYTLTSDAGNLMAEGQPFAACYMDTPRGRVFSLRSKADGVDVSEIAKAYGGGGHKNAAGFQVPFDQLAQFEAGKD
jgi:oligoribonuclease NrnB/cAMP/cGMP phosphodiesterase (DHH superfamily)